MSQHQSRQARLIESVDRLRALNYEDKPESVLEFLKNSEVCTPSEVAGLRLIYGLDEV